MKDEDLLDVLFQLPLLNKPLIYKFEAARKALGQKIVLGQEEVGVLQTWGELVVLWERMFEATDPKDHCAYIVPFVSTTNRTVVVWHKTSHSELSLTNGELEFILRDFEGEVAFYYALQANGSQFSELRAERCECLLGSEPPGLLQYSKGYFKRVYGGLVNYLLQGTEYLSEIS
ncbi:MAG: hypothetical protein JNN11_04135 [Candidatus Doudnabacteria bacterium]|nr:hypothetical protein [Candidatus Doudnabacteria bacterium]